MILTLVLYLRKVPGGFVIGIVVTSILAFILHLDTKAASSTSLSMLGSYGKLLFQTDFDGIFTVKFLVAFFSMTMILVFESMGLLQGLLGDSPNFQRAYRANALSAFCSSFMGTSPTVAAAESASGIESGGRTGLTSLTAGIMFLLSLFFIPLLSYVPDAAIAPVILITGALMMEQIGQVDLTDFSEWFPAFLIIVLIPLTGSISTGLAFGFVAYPVAKLAAGQKKDLSKTLVVLAGLFLLQLIGSALI